MASWKKTASILLIVMIILAATIVLSLNNTNILDKSETAVDKYDLQQVKALAATTWAEEYLEQRENNELNVKILEQEVMRKLEEQIGTTKIKK